MRIMISFEHIKLGLKESLFVCTMSEKLAYLIMSPLLKEAGAFWYDDLWNQ